MKKLTLLAVAALVSVSAWAQWSKYPACSKQHEADRVACNKVKDAQKRAVCWSSANERLAYCGKNGGKTGFPALLNK